MYNKSNFHVVRFVSSVASTTWQTVFMKLENNTKHLREDFPYRTMFRLSPRSSKEFETISKNYYNFILVRHPFHRLVSAYRDKISHCNSRAEFYKAVERNLGLKREADCSAHTDTGKIELDEDNKPFIEKVPVIIPTFR